MDYERLLGAARRGEAWSGTALVTVLMPMLIRYSEDVGSDLGPADRESAVETAVLKAVDRLERFDPSAGSFPAWVRGFLRHELATIRRTRGGIRPTDLNELAEALTVSSGTDSPENDRHSLTSFLLELSLADQVIIALRDFEGLTYAQAAERIGGGVSEVACRVRHHRALARLKKLLLESTDYAHLLGEES